MLLHSLFNYASQTIKKRGKLLPQKQAKKKAVVSSREMAEFILGETGLAGLDLSRWE